MFELPLHCPFKGIDQAMYLYYLSSDVGPQPRYAVHISVAVIKKWLQLFSHTVIMLLKTKSFTSADHSIFILFSIIIRYKFLDV
jgi:hypothetical protein